MYDDESDYPPFFEAELGSAEDFCCDCIFISKKRHRITASDGSVFVFAWCKHRDKFLIAKQTPPSPKPAN